MGERITAESPTSHCQNDWHTIATVFIDNGDTPSIYRADSDQVEGLAWFTDLVNQGFLEQGFSEEQARLMSQAAARGAVAMAQTKELEFISRLVE